jgi:NAD+-dependent protein deacetylase SIR2
MVRNLSGIVADAKPTAFHHMLETLGQEGRLLRLYTQNVDGIDVALPSLETQVPLPQKGPWPRTVQLHGGLEKMVCSKCRALSDFQPDLFDGPVPPACPSCIEADKIRTDHAGKRSHGVGRLRPRMVLYNEHNPDEDAIGAVMHADLRTRPDAIIVVGTSMKIPGVRRVVREMCGVVRGRRDGLTVWINQDGPPPGKDFEECWDLIVKGPCDEVARQWNLSMKPHKECTNSDIERAKDETKVEVVVNTPQKPKSQGIMTPAPSPMPKPLPTVKFIVKKPSEFTKDSKLPKKDKTSAKSKETNGTNAKRVRKNKSTANATNEPPKATLAKSHFKVSKPSAISEKLSKPAPADATLPETLAKQSTPPTDQNTNGTNPTRLDRNVLFPNLTPGKRTDHMSQQNSLADLSFSSPLTDLDSSIVDKLDTPTCLKIEAPQTPQQDEPRSPSVERLGTVSPPSVPRGMEALLS